MALKASIDIGTNSTRLLIADVDINNTITPIVHLDRVTRLGLGFDKDRRLNVDAMQRVLSVLHEYRTLLYNHNIQDTIAFATSACRDAVNGREFMDMIQAETGFNSRIISGHEEAALSFAGVISDMRLANNHLVCDIGGGSTEYIYSQGNKFLTAKSLNIGSRRLTTRFIKNDPITLAEFELLQQYIFECLAELDPFTPDVCTSVGGTATTLTMIDQKTDSEDAGVVHKKVIKLQNLNAIIHDLVEKSIYERTLITGLNPDRADVILTGATIIKCTLEYFHLSETITSLRDLLFGVLLDNDPT